MRNDNVCFLRVPWSRHVLYYFALGGSSGLQQKIAGLLGHAEYHFEMTRKGLVFISRDVLHEEHYEDNEGIKSFFQLVLSMPNCDLYSPHGPCRVSEVASTDCALDAQRMGILGYSRRSNNAAACEAEMCRQDGCM